MRKLVLACLTIGASAFAAGSINGNGGDMPAYYDGVIHTINFKPYPSGGATATHNNNGQINIIFQCDSCAGLINGGDFVSVLNAIQGDGFNPIWEEWQITFNQGFAPRQLTSDNDVFAAQSAGEITLTDTDEMYRCSVVK